MFSILIVGITMAVASAVFWCIEAVPFVKAIQKLKKPDQSRNSFIVTAQSIKFVAGFIGELITLWPLAIDLVATMLLCAGFNFGGMVGGVIGLTVSNVISVFLLIISRMPKEEKW